VFAIETQALTKRYGQARGIIDVNLQVERGEVFGFIGPNGAGKTTTIRTLLNYLFPTSGRGSILGHDIVTESKEIKGRVGYLPSEGNYYEELKVRQLLDFSASFYGQDCSRRSAELADRLQVEMDKGIEALSTGNKRKVGIVMAMMHSPDLLILDEASNGLDPLMQQRFFDILREENQRGTTIFFSSHNLSEVQRLCNRVAMIKEGRILEIEEVDELRRRQLRRVRVTLSRGATPSSLMLKGMVDSVQDNGTLRFLYSGEINQLINELSGLPVENLWIEEPSLEEVFLHRFEGQGEQA